MRTWMWKKLALRGQWKWMPMFVRAVLIWFTWVGRAYTETPDGKVWRFTPAHAWEMAWMEAGWYRRTA